MPAQTVTKAVTKEAVADYAALEPDELSCECMCVRVCVCARACVSVSPEIAGGVFVRASKVFMETDRHCLISGSVSSRAIRLQYWATLRTR